ncbi:hypothetical protein Emed_003627 [Eimeria media]
MVLVRPRTLCVVLVSLGIHSYEVKAASPLDILTNALNELTRVVTLPLTAVGGWAFGNSRDADFDEDAEMLGSEDPEESYADMIAEKTDSAVTTAKETAAEQAHAASEAASQAASAVGSGAQQAAERLKRVGDGGAEAVKTASGKAKDTASDAYTAAKENTVGGGEEEEGEEEDAAVADEFKQTISEALQKVKDGVKPDESKEAASTQTVEQAASEAQKTIAEAVQKVKERTANSELAAEATNAAEKSERAVADTARAIKVAARPTEEEAESARAKTAAAIKESISQIVNGTMTDEHRGGDEEEKEEEEAARGTAAEARKYISDLVRRIMPSTDYTTQHEEEKEKEKEEKDNASAARRPFLASSTEREEEEKERKENAEKEKEEKDESEQKSLTDMVKEYGQRSAQTVQGAASTVGKRTQEASEKVGEGAENAADAVKHAATGEEDRPM